MTRAVTNLGDKDGEQQLADSARPNVRLWNWLAIAAIVVAGGIAYYNSFDGVFVFDGIKSIQDNPHIRKLWPLSDAMSWPMINGNETVSRRPMLSLSFALNYFALGPEPWGYHLINLSIHTAAALLLFGIVRRTLCRDPFRVQYGEKSTALALVIALIWLVHPLQTESVTYIVQRAESLMGMLYLLALYCSMRGFTSDRANYWYVAAVLACTVGMAVKEVMFTVPIIVLLYDGSFVSKSFQLALRKRWKFYIALVVATWSVFLGITALGWKEASTDFTERSPMGYALSQPGVILYYLRLSIWPSPLLINYDWSNAKTFVDIVPPLCVVLVLLGVTAWGLFRRTWFGFLGAWFFLILGPSSSFASLKQNLAEHRMYLSLAAVVALMVLTGEYALRKALVGRLSTHARLITSVLVIGIVVLLTTRTMLRNTCYYSEIGLWRDNFEKRPASWPSSGVSHNNYGVALFERGQVDEAIAYYQQAIAINRDYSTAHYNLGNAFFNKGDSELPKAILHYQRAIEINSDYAEAHNNLGSALFEYGDLDKAVVHFRKAISINPYIWQAHLRLGSLYLDQGQRNLAIEHLRQAAQVRPDSREVQAMLRRAVDE